MVNPLISIIIPVYNSEKYISECINSILSQIYTNYELVIIDDGSNDNSSSICQEFEGRNKNISYLKQENSGVDKARNYGLENCNGEYVAFIDSDDKVERNWLQDYANLINKGIEADMIIQGLFVDYPNHIHKTETNDCHYSNNEIGDLLYNLNKDSIDGFLHNKLYKRDIIETYNIRFKYTLKEDLLFNMDYYAHAKSIQTIKVWNYHYIQRGSQSLINRRYSPFYMKNLITDIKDKGLMLSHVFKNDLYKNKILSDYIISYSALLYSMYGKANRISKKDRIDLIKDYHKEAKRYRNIRIERNCKSKYIFAKFAKLPCNLVDSVLNTIL